VNTIIQQLNLEPHREGGFYRQTYESRATVKTRGGPRPLMNCIYYLLTRGSPIGHFHRVGSDITHFYHLGGPIHFLLISQDGKSSKIVAGPDLDKGHILGFTIPGGNWFCSYLDEKAEFGLISEAVAPGFDFADHAMATHDDFSRDFPHLYDDIKRYISDEI
jgi:predicted cupin superfamily sugar epimerase